MNQNVQVEKINKQKNIKKNMSIMCFVFLWYSTFGAKKKNLVETYKSIFHSLKKKKLSLKDCGFKICKFHSLKI